MKQTILLSTLLCASITSCTNNENFYDELKQEISFTPVQHQHQSRTEVTKGALETNTHFGVYAWYGSEDEKINTAAFMENVEITFSDNKWQPAAPYYWLKNNSISFVAYAPYTTKTTANLFLPTFTVSETTNENNISYTDVIVDPTKNQDSKDIMYSNKTRELTGNTNDFIPKQTVDTYQGVPIIFNHALAKVSFKFKNGTLQDSKKTTSWEVEITKCTLNKVETKGNLSLVLNEDKKTWKLPKNYIWTAGNSTTNWDLCNSNNKSKLTLTGELIPLQENIYVIPQATKGISLSIGYSIKTTLPNNKEITENFTKEISDISTINQIAYWAINKHITYNITIDPKGNEIYFAPTVSDWGTSTGTPDNIKPTV